MDDIWSVKVDDEADLDFQMALNKVRKMKQKAVVKPSVKNVRYHFYYFTFYPINYFSSNKLLCTVFGNYCKNEIAL